MPDPKSESTADQQFSLFDWGNAEAEEEANPTTSSAQSSASQPSPPVASAATPVPSVPASFDPSQIPTSARIPIPAGTYGSMAEIKAHCSECQRCDLGATRTNAVISRGNPNALIMIIGEGPGENEDLTGQPFVGKAGQLLDKILESVRLTEDDVFICNIVKCRPPGNRKPVRDEMNACRPYLMEQIRLVDPKIIIMAGASAIEGLLNEKNVKITQIRGQWRDWEGRACMPVFHPSYLLRNPSRTQGSPKWLMWQDIQEVRRKFDELQSAL
ncbi:uracil-DNA glycosylase [Alkalinema pantanalense CENA528]|uniref:uracil-DNA glycosylase n=1 Tax=Alkalinema pantanalense TaxID=1620705 RepID=UPI003D6E5CE1